MDKKLFKENLEQIDAYLKQEGISRRDAMKMMGLGGTALMMGSGAVTQAKASSTAKGKILIVGGGLSGIATASKLSRELENPDITILEPNEHSVTYQPGQTLVGSGIWTKDDIVYNTADHMPSGVKWIKEKAVEFNPEANSVKTSGGKEIKYDYMIVAAGLALDFAAIKGLEEVGQVLSADAADAARAKKILGKNGLCSIYFTDGSVDTWAQMQELVNAAKSGKKLKALFPEPHTAFKCGGAQKKMVNLTNARLVEAGARDNVEMTFVTNGKKFFPVPEYHDSVARQMKERNVVTFMEHKMVAIDPIKKEVTFEKHWMEKGAYDPVLEEYAEVEKKEIVVKSYDFCHVIPPQIAPKEIGSSPIGSEKGWIPVNKETLQHEKYPNIFALGDIAAVPLGKTGGSARKQYKVVVENLIATMEGKKELPAKYNGYTVCPLITDIGKVMLAEFKWNPNGDKPAALAAPSFPLDPAQERWLYWALKVYLLKPMTIYGMLPGRA